MKKWLVMLLAAALLLGGCVVTPDTTGVQLGTKPTVEDLFTPPVATTGRPATDPTSTQSAQPTEPKQPSASIPMGGMGFGMRGDKKLDEFGSYFEYDGGEMCMPFMIQASGQALLRCVEEGIGILLFIDGQAQPYRVEPDGELAFFHILHPAFDTALYDMTQIRNVDLYFTPVSGQKGEMVEFYATTICSPEYQLSEPYKGFTYTSGAIQCGTRLKLNAKPPKVENPEVTERINSVDISYADTSYAEIAGWSDMDLIENYAFEFEVNGQPYPELFTSKVFGITAEEPVELRYEVWGTPYVEYGLMFYVDNQPISGQKVIKFSMKNGQKTVITVMMDLSDFDGEAVIYAALIPLNCRTTEIMTMAFLNMSSTYFMVDDPKPEK